MALKLLKSLLLALLIVGINIPTNLECAPKWHGTKNGTKKYVSPTLSDNPFYALTEEFEQENTRKNLLIDKTPVLNNPTSTNLLGGKKTIAFSVATGILLAFIQNGFKR